jgi:PAS domain S-box-containing protein
VLDALGVVIAVNDAWENFALQNGATDSSRVSVGANYLEVCRQATKAGDQAAEQALIGLESVLTGTVSHFAMDYPCSSPTQERWFTMTVLRQKAPADGAVVIHSDITDRKKSEEALRCSEERLRLLTDAVPVLISYVDGKQCYRFNNKAYENWFGHPREFVEGKHLKQVLGESAYRAIRPQVEAVLSGELVSFEDFIPYRGAGRRYVKVTYVPDRHDGKVRGFFALIQDLTERRQAEEEIRESHDKLSTIIAGADVGTWNWNIQAGTLDVNERFCTMLGYEPGSFGTDVRRFFDSLHPDDTEKVNRAVEEHFAGRSEIYRCDFRLRAADGSYKWIHDAGKLIERDHEGKPLRMVGIHMDLTEEKRFEIALKASEEEFRSMFELAGVGKAQADPTTGRFTRVNKKFCEITGYSQAELLAMTFRDITHEDDRERDESGVQRVFKGETDSWSIEKRYVRKDGTVLWVEVNGSLIKHKDGPMRAIANVVDITERKQSEQALTSAYKEIQQLKERLEAENIYLREEINVEHGFENIIGQSDAIKMCSTGYTRWRPRTLPSSSSAKLAREKGWWQGLFIRQAGAGSDRWSTSTAQCCRRT